MAQSKKCRNYSHNDNIINNVKYKVNIISIWS